MLPQFKTPPNNKSKWLYVVAYYLSGNGTNDKSLDEKGHDDYYYITNVTDPYTDGIEVARQHCLFPEEANPRPDWVVEYSSNEVTAEQMNILIGQFYDEQTQLDALTWTPGVPQYFSTERVRQFMEHTVPEHITTIRNNARFNRLMFNL
jgi:hypothetical protein